MHELPIVTFAAKHFGDTQIKRHWFNFAANTRSGPLQTYPVTDAVARRHLKNFEVVFGAGLELFRTALMRLEYVFPPLFDTTARPEEGRRRDVSDDVAEWPKIAAHISSRRKLAPFHELLEIVQPIVHIFFLWYFI